MSFHSYTYYDRLKAKNLFSWICTTNVHISRWHLYYDRVKARNLFSCICTTDIHFSPDIYIMIEWRPIIISPLLTTLTFPITSFIPSLMFSKTKKTPCFHRTGKRQIIEGDMTESKFSLSFSLFLSDSCIQMDQFFYTVRTV